ERRRPRRRAARRIAARPRRIRRRASCPPVPRGHFLGNDLRPLCVTYPIGKRRRGTEPRLSREEIIVRRCPAGCGPRENATRTAIVVRAPIGVVPAAREQGFSPP